MGRLKLTEGRQGGAWVITVAGELDLAVADQLEAAIDRVAADAVVLVDLEPCEFIDSTAIALFVAARRRRRADGRQLAILRPTDQVKRVLELTGLTDNGLVFESVGDAVAAG
ncbi:MAG TPA: STAS domain-containing protein [Solirubrobacterales bacterium]|nr:STAS domain-containing protein [Solirubrobacterales bacterium]